MQQVQLAGTDLSLSRLSLGTASLVSAGSRKTREAVLHAALDAGITHFDTAPIYGFGNSERDLGRVLAGREGITIATKVGLRSPGHEGQSVAETVLRKAAGRIVPKLSLHWRDFSLEWARQSLEGSLKRLGREHIDLYLLHEPDIALLELDEWSRWMEEIKSSGKVRHVGIAATPELIEPFLQAPSSSLTDVLQIADSVTGCEADMLTRYNREMQITFGYVRGSAGVPPQAAIKGALERNTAGSVIYSSRKPDRIAAMAALAR